MSTLPRSIESPGNSIKRVPKRLAALPPLPSVASKLLRLISDENVAIPAVARLIQTDMAFATEVLRLSNSSIIGLRYEVLSILHAVSVLGMDRVKALVMTVGMRDMLRGAKQGESLRLCWRHNLATALVCEWVGEPCWLDRSICYLAGLLHELGRFALVASGGAEYDKALQRHLETGRCLDECERDAFGMSQSEAGAWLASEWRLPAVLCRVAGQQQCVSPREDPSIESLAVLSCEVANQIGFTATGRPGEWTPEFLREKLPDDSWRKIESRLPELRESIPCMINLFECEFLR